MSLKVFKAGLLDTIQDLGRYGYQHLGINPGGAMDRFSASIANLLAGNCIETAVIELHFPASIFIFQRPALIALSGADFSASINGENIPSCHPVLVNRGSILQFHKVRTGARAYLAIHGGLDILPWLGSWSTHLKAAAGGYKGRSLQKEDEINFSSPDTVSSRLGDREFMVLPWKGSDPGEDMVSEEILILPGNEEMRLTEESKENLLLTSFVITNQSDRMGYRLNNIPLHSITREEIISAAVSFGTVQLLPDGKLIVLMADHQTTGGYPRIAHVITAHHSKLAQMKTGNKIHFKFTSQEKAEELLLKQQQHLLQLQNACTFRLSEFLNK